MDRRIRRQIRKILEEGTGDHRSVIVRMVGPQRDVSPMLQDACRVLRTRSLALTARDSLPADRQPEHTATSATPRPLIRSDRRALKGSLSAQVTPTRAPRKPQQVKDQTLE